MIVANHGGCHNLFLGSFPYIYLFPSKKIKYKKIKSKRIKSKSKNNMKTGN
jgi:hypothetical protein